MKKLLGIVVLGLLLSGNAYAGIYKSKYKNYFDMNVSGNGFNKKSFQNAEQQALLECQKESKLKNLRVEGCLLFELHGGTALDTLFDREVEKNFWNVSVDKFEKSLKLDEIIQGVKFKTKEEKKEKKEKIELAEIIDKAKTTCQTLGFEQGTDKFSDCTLKLYSQEVDNKVALEVAKQKSSSGSSNSGTMVIYDPVRDRQNKIDKGMEMITGRCTLGTDC
jgi:hypothetical protein